MQKYYNYLYDHKIPSFGGGCDVLLKLDDGSDLPAHSEYLARYSKVCQATLDDGVLSGTSTSKKVVLPLTDCSRATLISLLSALYSKRPMEHITKKSSMGMFCLAHKLDMKDIEDICYRVFLGKNDHPATGHYGMPYSLQNKDPKTFRDLLNLVVLLGKDEAVASYEHCIAMDVTGRFNRMIQHMPPESWVRIIECNRQGFHMKKKYWENFLKNKQWIPWTTEDFLKHKRRNTFQKSCASWTADWDMKEIAKRCADVQSGRDYYLNGNYSLPFALKDKGPKTFRDLWDYALLNGMDKALASCEHCIVLDCRGKFNQMIQHMPSKSVVRMVEFLRQGFHALDKYKSWKEWTTEGFLPHKS